MYNHCNRNPPLFPVPRPSASPADARPSPPRRDARRGNPQSPPRRPRPAAPSVPPSTIRPPCPAAPRQQSPAPIGCAVRLRYPLFPCASVCRACAYIYPRTAARGIELHPLFHPLFSPLSLTNNHPTYKTPTLRCLLFYPLVNTDPTTRLFPRNTGPPVLTSTSQNP